MDDLSFNKVLNEKYHLIKDIAKNNNYTEELLNMLTFLFIAFYMDLGKDAEYPLYDIINNIKIIFEQGTLNDIAKKYKLKEMPESSVAITIFTNDLRKSKMTIIKQKPQTIILGTNIIFQKSKQMATPTLILEMLMHEIRHILMGYYNSNIILDDNINYCRTGLHEIKYYPIIGSNDNYNIQEIGKILDEIYNTYATELLINRIIRFKKYNIQNQKLKIYLDSIMTHQPDNIYRSIGYNSMIRLFLPLLINKTLFDLVNYHQFDGQIQIIKDFIEHNSNLCNYEELNTLIDQIFSDNNQYETKRQENDMDFITTHINNIQKMKRIVLDINKNISQ